MSEIFDFSDKEMKLSGPFSFFGKLGVSNIFIFHFSKFLFRKLQLKMDKACCPLVFFY